MNDEDFYRDLAVDVDDAHAAWDEANNAPPALWQRIRAQYSLEKEDTTMNMNPALSSPVFTRTHTEVGTMQRFSGMVATLAIVGILAFGGWFAAMNLPPANDGKRFAMLQATPMTAATCDVEPLTVDQVMSIVRNPVPYTYDGSAASPTAFTDEGLARNMAEKERRIAVPNPIDAGRSVMLMEDQFSDASVFADAYLGCLIAGTQAQVWGFYHPAAIQATILAQFPVYANEDEVRLYVEERSEQPAILGEAKWAWLPFIDDVTSATINPNMKLTITRNSDFSGIEAVMYAGVVIETKDDGVVVRSNGSGTNLIPNDPMLTGKNTIILRITLVKPYFSDVWMVIPYPSVDEMMRNLPES